MPAELSILRTIGLGAAIGAGVGTLLGCGLGIWVPGYLRAAFGGVTAEFSPVQVGIGLGLLQGGAVGIALGVAVRLLRILERRPKTEAAPSPWLPRLVFAFAALITLSLCSGTGFVLGGVLHELRSSNLASRIKSARIREAWTRLAIDGLETVTHSDGSVHLTGTLPKTQLDSLREALRQEFGVRETEGLLAGVRTGNAP